jgi:hypothetical protein
MLPFGENYKIEERNSREILVQYALAVEKITACLKKTHRFHHGSFLEFEAAALVYYDLWSSSPSCRDWFWSAVRYHVQTIIEHDEKNLFDRVNIYYKSFSDHKHEEYKFINARIFDIFSRLLSLAGKYDDPEYEYEPYSSFRNISGIDPMKIEDTIKLSSQEINDCDRILNHLHKFSR